MQCPIDGTALVIAERSGVEIDYCPKCRGVWLDRGELDKIIERSAAYSAPPPPPQQQRSRGSDNAQYQGKPRKKKGMGSFLEDIFDF
jgi:Zn-finger nucleic acid-binding protein